ncbi:MAG: hypothetical protein WBG93_10755 [Thermoanaerobaculia bacterium]
MLLQLLITAAILLTLITIAIVSFVRWGEGWGATPAERSMQMPGGVFFTDRAPAFVAMTRAVSIAAPPEIVWPWLAQLGRGAGWYSYDLLDNGGLMSAEHIVSWIPPIQLGDASPIGYVHRLVDGTEITWWVPGTRFLAADARLTVDIGLHPEKEGSRLVIRMAADATGTMARPALWVFMFIDSIIAIRQLHGIKERVEAHGARATDSERPETGARDQYQLYEVIYASGERAGAPGKEAAEKWHRAAKAAGLIDPPQNRSETPTGAHTG